MYLCTCKYFYIYYVIKLYSLTIRDFYFRSKELGVKLSHK